MAVLIVTCIDNATGFPVGLIMPGLTKGRKYEATKNGHYYDLKDDSGEWISCRTSFFQREDAPEGCLVEARRKLRDVVRSWESTRGSALELVTMTERAWIEASTTEGDAYVRFLDAMSLLEQGDRQARLAEDHLKLLERQISEQDDQASD